MRHEDVFGNEIGRGGKKARISAMARDLLDLHLQGATYRQLTSYLEREHGLSVDARWLRRILRERIDKNDDPAAAVVSLPRTPV